MIKRFVLLLLLLTASGIGPERGLAQQQTQPLLRTFRNPTLAQGDRFGYAVAGVGSNVLIGAPEDNTGAADAGSAYLFDGSTGALLQTFRNPTPAGSDRFGSSVAGVGSNVLIGAPFDDAGAADAGVAYLINGSTGDTIRTFRNPTPAAGDQFGFSVAAMGSNVLIGAPFDDTEGIDAGSAYLFDGSTGALLRTFYNPPPAAGDRFGFSVAGVGSNVLIGAPFNDAGAADAGSAYPFEVEQVSQPPVPGGGGTVSLGKTQGIRGDSMMVKVSTSDAKGLAGGDFTLNYDAGILTPKGVQAASLVASAGMVVFANLNAAGQVRVSMAGAGGIASGSGDLLIVTFDVKQDARLGATPLRLEAALIDSAGTTISTGSDSTSAIIWAGLLGDVNLDKKVDSGDAVRVLQHATGFAPLPDELRDLGDVNGDGRTNAADAVLILRRSVGAIVAFPREAASKPVLAWGGKATHQDTKNTKEGAREKVWFGEMAMTSATGNAPYSSLIPHPSLLLEVPVVLEAGVSAADLILTYDVGTYGQAQISAPEGALLIVNNETPGEVHLSIARTDATGSVELRVALKGGDRGSGIAKIKLQVGWGDGTNHESRTTNHDPPSFA